MSSPRWSRVRAPISGSLYPPGGYLQRLTGEPGRRSCQLSLARLEGRQTPEGHDTGSERPEHERGALIR
jgi:hypothetical protein